MGRPRKHPIKEQPEMLVNLIYPEVKEEPKVEAPMATVSDYSSLFSKIDSLQGLEKMKFCKTLTDPEKKAYVKSLKERDCQMVTGVFRCFEPLGGTVQFTAMAYEGEVPVKYTFFDGETYTIPRYIAKRIEGEFQGVGTFYPTNTYLLDSMGNPMVGVGKKTRRFGFSTGMY